MAGAPRIMGAKPRARSTYERSPETTDTSFPESVSLKDLIDSFSTLANIFAAKTRLSLRDANIPSWIQCWRNKTQKKFAKKKIAVCMMPSV